MVDVGQICQKERENVTFKVPLWSIICLSLSFLQLNVWATLCRMVYVQCLTQEGCFLVHLLQEDGFSLLTENLIMRGGAKSRFGDITNSLEAIPGPACTSVKLEGSCANTQRIEWVWVRTTLRKLWGEIVPQWYGSPKTTEAQNGHESNTLFPLFLHDNNWNCICFLEITSCLCHYHGIITVYFPEMTRELRRDLRIRNFVENDLNCIRLLEDRHERSSHPSADIAFMRSWGNYVVISW